MAFTITLFKFQKRKNSLKRPEPITGTSFTCTMKTASSVYAPVIDIRMKVQGAYDPNEYEIPTYNYAYIESFGRYYFITDTVYNLGIWTIYLSCDVLASFRSDILNSTQYVLRSFSDYNPNIIDSLYLSTPMHINSRSANYTYLPSITNSINYDIINGTESGTMTYWNKKYNQGDFVVGIVNSTSGVDFYIMSYNVFKDFINKVCALVPSGMSDLEQTTANAVFNPLQYITSCNWYPAVPPAIEGTGTSSLKVGSQTVNISGTAYLMDVSKMTEFYFEIQIPRHPHADDYPYLNLSPFTEYTLNFQPFGSIPIDSYKIYQETHLYVAFAVDFTVGSAHLKIHPARHANQRRELIAEMTTQYGVPVPIASFVMDTQSALIVGGINWVKNAIMSDYSSANNSRTYDLSKFEDIMALTASSIGNDIKAGAKKVVSENMSLVNTAIDAVGCSLGQLQTKGTLGSFLAYSEQKPIMFAFFYDQAPQNPELFGRPCHANHKLSDLSGFCLCQNADVSTFDGDFKPTINEQTEINNLLNSGVVIEGHN